MKQSTKKINWSEKIRQSYEEMETREDQLWTTLLKNKKLQDALRCGGVSLVKSFLKKNDKDRQHWEKATYIQKKINWCIKKLIKTGALAECVKDDYDLTVSDGFFLDDDDIDMYYSDAKKKSTT